MTQTRKTRIPSVSYLEQKIAELGVIVNPTQDQTSMLEQYKKLIEQRLQNEKHIGLLEKA